MAMPQTILLQTKTIYSTIENFINKKALNSINTAKAYESDIRQFFMTVKNKHIEKLLEEDLQTDIDEVEYYQTRLATDLNDGKPYGSSTIERKIGVLRSLYSKLEAKYDVKEAWFKVDKIKGESKSWGVVSWDEVEKMIEFVRDTRKGNIKASLIETAVITSFRQNELLELEWSNLKQIDGVWVLEVTYQVGKGRKSNMKPINDDLYERLISLKKDNNKIFDISKKAVGNMMIKMREELGLDDDITFHSLKKCGINEVYELTNGDIMAVAEQGNHSNFDTAYKHYMNKKKNYSQMACLKIGQKVDLSPLEELSKEDLLELISNSSRSAQMEIINGVKNI